MKKLMIFALIAALLTSGALAEDAGSAFDLELDEDTWLSSSVMMGSRLYLLVEGEFCAYTPGAQELEKIAVRDERPVSETVLLAGEEGEEAARHYYGFRLFADGESLYAADLQSSEMIYPLALEGDGLVIREGVKVDTAPLRNMEFDDEGYVEDPLQMLGHEGRLYLISRTWRGGGVEALELFSYDLEKGGEAQKHEAEQIRRLAPYKEGKLLALVMDPKESYDPAAMENRNFMLCAWDPQDDSLEQLGDSGVAFEYETPAFYYDRQTDMAYIQGKTEVWRMKPGEAAEICAYLMPTQYGGNLGDGLYLLEDGRLLSIRGRNISLREGDPDKLPKGRLSIYGAYADDTHSKTIRAMNGIPVTFLDSTWFSTAQQLGQALVSGDDSIDIFFINSSYIDIQNLMKKGYAQNLSASEGLKAYADSLYPQMREVGILDGWLYMVPVDVQMENVFSYYSALAEQVEGFELPHTYDELIDAIQNWNDSLGEENPDFTIMHEDDFKGMAIVTAIRLYADWTASQGKPFSYADPQLKGMLERALNLNTENIAAKIDWRSPDAQEQAEELYSRAPMLDGYYWLDLEQLNRELEGGDDDSMVGWGSGDKMYKVGQHLPLLLAIREGEEAVAPLTLTVMAVNPKSKNLDAAIAYAEEYVKHIGEAKKAMMNPNMNEDIPNPNYEREIKWMAENETSMKEYLDKAEGAEKTEAEKNYQQMLKENEKRRERARYSVSAATIAFYRDMIKNSYVRGYDPGVNSPDIAKLLQRLADGQVKLDQFVSEADGKLRLILLEGQ